MILPVPVSRNLLLEPLCVFIFGMSPRLPSSVPVARLRRPPASPSASTWRALRHGSYAWQLHCQARGGPRHWRPLNSPGRAGRPARLGKLVVYLSASPGSCAPPWFAAPRSAAAARGPRAGPGLGAAPAVAREAAGVLRGAVGFGVPLLAGPGRALDAGVARGADGFGVALGLAADDRADVVAPGVSVGSAGAAGAVAASAGAVAGAADVCAA